MAIYKHNERFFEAVRGSIFMLAELEQLKSLGHQTLSKHLLSSFQKVLGSLAIVFYYSYMLCNGQSSPFDCNIEIYV